MTGFESLLETYGLLAIFAITFVKSIGVPIPIPSDVIMLAAAALAAQGKIVLWQAFIVLWVALVLGGAIQFELAGGPGRRFLARFGPYLGLTATRLDAVGQRVKRGGILTIGVAVLTPGLRAAAVASCGLLAVPRAVFLPGLTLGSAAFLALHFAIGYVGGAVPGQIIAQRLSTPVLALVALLAAGLVIWVVIRHRQRPRASTVAVLADAVEAWHEATCPVCLVLGTAGDVKPIAMQ